MGKQSCLVMLGVTTMLLAVVLIFVALGTPKWIISYKNSDVTNDTMKGLWQLCEAEDCSPLDQSLQGPWFRSVQVVLSLAAVFALLGLLLFGYLFVVEGGMEKKYFIIYGVAVISLLSNMLLITGLSIFAAEAVERTIEVPEPRKLYWSFYLAVLAGIFSVASTGLLCYVGSLGNSWSKVRPYYDI